MNKKLVGHLNVRTGAFTPWEPLSQKTDTALSSLCADALSDDHGAYEHSLDVMRRRLTELEGLVRQGMLIMPMDVQLRQDWMRKAINAEVGNGS